MTKPRFLIALDYLPESALYALAGLIRFMLFNVVRYRRDTVDLNLTKAFPEKSAAERLQLAKDFYQHLADVIVETVILNRLSAEELLGRVEVVGCEHMQALVDQQRSFLLLSAHQANWEWMLAALSISCPCPMNAIYRPLHIPAMEEWFRTLRTRFGASLIPAENAARSILRCRKEVRAFGIIADQNPRRLDDKFWLPFLGVETPAFPGPDRIARLTNYPALFVATEKLARGRYRCTITPLATPPYEQEDHIARLFMQRVEAQILHQPALWMWSHRRWRYTRQDCPPRP